MAKRRSSAKKNIEENDIQRILPKRLRLKCKNKIQKEFYHLITNHEIIFAAGPAGVGKAQPLYSKILTPNGWTTMGEVNIGDKIIGSNGKSTIVNGVFPQGKKDIYRVHFSDGSYTDTCDEHLWLTQTYYDRNYRVKKDGVRIYKPRKGSVKTLSEIMETLFTNRGDKNHTIPIIKPVEFNQKEYFIDPYIMGCLLGDGGLTQNRITFTTEDVEIVENIKEHLNENHSINKKNGKYHYSIIGQNNRNLILEELDKLNLKNTNTYNKHIPDNYKFTSIEDRIAILQGLMDTDGYVNKKGTSVFFTNTSKKLIDDVVFLVNSLGGVCRLNDKIGSYKNYKGENVKCKRVYTLTISLPPEINPFRLSRKADLVKPKTKYIPKRYIIAVEPIGNLEAQCISVEADDSLYVTDHFIVTHNTYVSVARAIELLQNQTSPYQRIIISTPAEEVGENLGYLPGPQPLYSKILTPDGWKTMDEIKVNDIVVKPDGNHVRVLKTFDKGVKPIYEIKTTNGGITHASGDHPWVTKTYSEHKHNKPWQLRSTSEIKETLYNPNKGPKLNHYIPSVDVINYNSDVELPISPYVLGCLLGDGCFSNSIIFSSKDNDIINRVKNEVKEYGIELTNTNGINYLFKDTNIKNNKVGRLVKITQLINDTPIIYSSIGEALKFENINRSTLQYRCDNKSIIDGKKYEFLPNHKRWSNYIKNVIYDLGLEGKKSYNKFIPDMYKYTSIDNRVALLQGLMDSDGTIKKTNGSLSYSTSSKKLAEDIVELCRSLGSNATIRVRDRKNKLNKVNSNHLIYCVHIPHFKNIKPFYLNRKRKHLKSNDKNHNIRIKEINFIGHEPTKCILINSDKHLYITDDFIVTHNTVREKIEPYVDSTLDIFDVIMGKKKRMELEEAGLLVIQPLGFIRGKSISNTILIMEEAQNMSVKQMKALLTRIGENSKFIISGDLDQSDRFTDPKKSGLYDAIERHKNIDEIGFIKFEEKDIVRNPLITKIIDNYKIDNKIVINDEKVIKTKPVMIKEDFSNVKPKIKPDYLPKSKLRKWFERNFKW